MAALRIVLMLLAGSALWPALVQAAEPAGTIIFATGETLARTADGKERPLARGVSVYPGDTLETGNGRIQIRFSDGGFVSLQTHSRFAIDAYHFDKEPATDQSKFSLLKGALRAITGLIGRRSRESYSVTTAVATIGIRGTAFAARYCAGDCPAENGKALADGLYVDTGAGTIRVANAAGELDVSAGQSAYVPSAQRPPRPLDTRPLLEQAGGDALPHEPQFLMGEQVDETGLPLWLDEGIGADLPPRTDPTGAGI